jgi:hypothetical protein
MVLLSQHVGAQQGLQSNQLGRALLHAMARYCLRASSVETGGQGPKTAAVVATRSCR